MSYSTLGNNKSQMAMTSVPIQLVEKLTSLIGSNRQESPQGFEPTNSRDPNVWGPYLWTYLHTSAINYPDNPSKHQQNGMKRWLRSMKWSIPCESCAIHFGKYIETHSSQVDQAVKSRDGLFAFLVELHNKVNDRLGKRRVSVAEAMKIYDKF